MTTASCRKSGRKHTPIVSEAQRGKMGAELRQRREGKKSTMPGMSEAELVRHLKEAKGKNLVARVHKKLKKVYR